MQELHSHHDFTASKADVWELLVDFGNIERWWPTGEVVDIDHVDLEGSGIGMTRHIYNVGFSAAVSERLDSLDMDNFCYQLSIVGERPAGLLEYQATGKIIDLNNGGCRLTYDSKFITEPGRESEAKEFLLAAYQLMYRGLESTSTPTK